MRRERGLPDLSAGSAMVSCSPGQSHSSLPISLCCCPHLSPFLYHKHIGITCLTLMFPSCRISVEIASERSPLLVSLLAHWLQVASGILIVSDLIFLRHKMIVPLLSAPDQEPPTPEYSVLTLSPGHQQIPVSCGGLWIGALILILTQVAWVSSSQQVAKTYA